MNSLEHQAFINKTLSMVKKRDRSFFMARDYKKKIKEIRTDMKNVIKGEKLLVNDYLRLMLIDDSEREKAEYNIILDEGVAEKLKVSSANAIKSK